MRTRKKCRLTAGEKRALASACLVVMRYQPDGARATVRELVPESDQRRRSFARRLADEGPARDEEAQSARSSSWPASPSGPTIRKGQCEA